jgi:hypothetical protein
MRTYFNSPELASDRAVVNGWLTTHSARLIGRVDDQTYGLMEIYSVQR